jgi:Flp pilus assembly pilin Flp
MIARSKFSAFKSLMARLARDEQGGELVEWILVVGLIALVCIVSMGALGLKLTIRWNDVLNVM